MRQLIVLAFLAACDPTTPTGSVADGAREPLGDAFVAARAVGLPGAQGASRSFVSIEPVDSCPDALTSWDGPDTVLVTPPEGDGTGWAPAKVVRLNSDGCAVIATLPDPDDSLRTGFAFDDDGTLTWAGLMLRTVQTDSALWVVSNTTTTAWRVDLDTADVQRRDVLERPVSGITQDGAGGAWAVLMAVADRVGDVATVPFTLVRLDSELQPTGESVDLPTLGNGTGFASITADDQVIDRFLATDVAVDGQGAVWITHSLDSTLLRVADGEITHTVDLGLAYPTGLAWVNERPVVATGALWSGDALIEPPSLWSVDDMEQPPTLWSPMDAPVGDYAVYSGFEKLTDAGRTSLAGWFDLQSTELGEVIVADPRGARVLTVQPTPSVP